MNESIINETIENITNKNITINPNEIITNSEGKLSGITGWVATKFSEFGIPLSTSAIRILSLIIISLCILVLLNVSQKVVKIVAIILMIIFVVIVTISFIGSF